MRTPINDAADKDCLYDRSGIRFRRDDRKAHRRGHERGPAQFLTRHDAVPARSGSEGQAGSKSAQYARGDSSRPARAEDPYRRHRQWIRATAAGQEFILTVNDVSGDGSRVSVSLKSLPQEVKAGDPILLADGNIELRVEKIVPPDIHCRVIVGGLLSSHKGINLPGSEVHVDSLTEKDRKDIVVGLEEGVDAIALSFVRRASDILACKTIIDDHGRHVPIVAKIEKHEAVENIDSIVAASQAVMVARGDLGVEIDLEKVPLVQKSVIRKCNALGKPVITATQMLQRMVDNPRPTRAEATDVANAILDGTDAVMLSDETAVGKYPVEAVMMMDRIARSAESALDELKFENIPIEAGTSDAISRASYFIAKEIGAAAIITPTWSGSTACLVSRFRPKQQIIATTPSEAALDFLALCWGVTPLLIPSSDTMDDMIRFSIDAA